MKVGTGAGQTVGMGMLMLLGSSLGAGAAEKAVMVLDGSGSMWGRIGDVSKIEIAREVIDDLMRDWSPEVELGITAYGHREKGNCNDIERLRPVGPVDPAAVRETIATIVPKGKTPLTAAVRDAATSLRYQEERATVILVSDGEETCGGDPCAAARELEAAGIDFTVHVVGFDLSEGETAALRCVADHTGGRFLQAGDADELHQAMTEVRAVVVEQAQLPPARKERVVRKLADRVGTLTVSNLADRQIGVCAEAEPQCVNFASPGWAGAVTPDQPTLDLPPGRYQMLTSRDRSETFTIVAGETTELAIGRITIPNLADQEIGVCDQQSDCINFTSEGWAGSISPDTRSLELPSGRYKLKVGSHVSEPIALEGGSSVEFAMGAITIPGLADEEIGICGQQSDCINFTSQGWVGTVSADQPTLELPPGTYKLKIDRENVIEGIEVGEGEEVVLER